jgi:TrmH family RNA methyltransferase
MLSKARIRDLQRYHRKKHRVADGRLLVEGWRSLEAVAGAGVVIETLFLLEDVDEAVLPAGLIAELSSRSERTDRVTPAQMKTLSSSVTPPNLAALITWRPLETAALVDAVLAEPRNADGRTGGSQLLVVADGVSDPGNLGTIIRTADWFGARGVFCGPGSVELTNPKVVQATMGSLFQLPVSAGDSTAAFLEQVRELGYSIVSLELDGATDIREVAWPKKLVVIVGNEARGVSDDIRALADRRVMIPRFGRAESLNAAAALAAVLGYVCLRPSSD